jgi:hypothetical protein
LMPETCQDAPTNRTNNGLDLLHGPRADIG